jgi:tetratricopeptide (TPR) repeat protein
MMIEQHYDEEVLAGFLGEPVDSAARDKHLAGCSLCKRTLESLRGTAGLLKEEEVWERPSFSSTPRPETLTFLRGVQQIMRDEDAVAEIYVKQLLVGSRDTWSARLNEHPEWRTAGVVRKLIAGMDRAIDVMPADAVEVTRMAVEIADYLEETRLSGNAWCEHGYTLLYTGAYNEGLSALARAEAQFSAISDSEHEVARVNVIRSMLYRALDRVDDALAVNRAAASVFKKYGDIERNLAARSARGILLYTAHRFREALAIHLEILSQAVPEMRWYASALQNAATCYRELGEFDAAIEYFVKAIAAFEKAGMISFRAKARWTLARVLIAQQRYSSALQMLNELRCEFEELGMANDVACVALDTAEVLLALGNHAEISGVCLSALAYFERSGLTSSGAALTAVHYLSEAAVAGKVTSTLVSDLRLAFLTDSKRLSLVHAPSPS